MYILKIFVAEYEQLSIFNHIPFLFLLNRKSIYFYRSESKGATTTKELSEASALADSINKAIKVLETKNMIDEQSKINKNALHIVKLTFVRN